MITSQKTASDWKESLGFDQAYDANDDRDDPQSKIKSKLVRFHLAVYSS
jgi:hypothetical protein